ncbi:hypothetical protein ABB37_03640 [Leptomonas pyrrhocoris]|uniref:PCI domain-containing protein n=1 Tax=Leptomonas pyrrhocoris TaxID=157538 RepID=A0A0M9G2R1_LEPPY|nr:hypothetical protein ABB37_03640 [Leptomonas pyrrhocoris]KPA81220.1 hypothetical protein ABB37_03640 [Leptomonas pyrrhocoris]|eukprot:XP_015659659.1 hypothetical protein ABB37_03640 [Leptomonas pyrrhocoris]
MLNKYFTIDRDWMEAAAAAICSRNGIILKDVIAKAEQGIPLRIVNDTAATLRNIVHVMQTSIEYTCNEYLKKHEGTLRLFRAAHPSSSETILANEERRHCREMVVRVAITGALTDFQRRNRKCVHDNPASSQVSSTQGETESPGRVETTDDDLERSVQTTLLKGLLYAFEAFQECHSMNRDHYPPRKDNSTPGTVGWDTLVMLYLVHRIPQVARHASGSAIDESIGQVIRTWRKLLVALQSVDSCEAPEHSRRRGALALVNGLLIILFQRYNTHQCAVLLSAVDHAEKVAASTAETSRSILHPSRHMISEVVTYYYYSGRMRLYERQLEEAHRTLREAYTLLPPAGFGNEPQRLNKERVRFFLTVAGVANGRRIPMEILRADEDLLPRLFGSLVWAIERGDPVRFSRALDTHAPVFHRRGVYLILQQAKILCYLMAVARVHAAMAALPDTDNSRITITTLLAAYEFITKAEEKNSNSTPSSSTKKRSREDGETCHTHESADTDAIMDEDRMALWVAKLIARGYIRGYYSHEHKTLVLSKKTPFPHLQAAP